VLLLDKLDKSQARRIRGGSGVGQMHARGDYFFEY